MDRTTQEPPLDPDDLKVSVVIAAYNEEAHLAECLHSLGEQTRPPHEIILVDDGSTDRTAEVATGFPGVQVLRQRHLGAAVARNAGAEVASGDVLVFFDGDMVMVPAFLEKLIAPLKDPEVPGTFTKEIFVANPEKRWARAHMLGRGLPLDRHLSDDFPDNWDIFRAIRTELFRSVGGFDQVGHGEDITLGRKLGLKAAFAPGATCRHYEPERLSDVFASAVWLGRGIRLTEKRDWYRDYYPHRSVGRALKLVYRHRLLSLLWYRLVWDLGIVWGALTRGRSRAK